MNTVKSKAARKSICWKLDKRAVSVVCEGSAEEDVAWWRTRSPDERFQHIEYLRQVNYGYNPATSRLQRVLEVVKCRPR
jgi:hypothetical protein